MLRILKWASKLYVVQQMDPQAQTAAIKFSFSIVS